MSEHIHWEADVPALRAPTLVIALDGFVDAGAAGSTAATFLRHRWRAEVVARFDREAFLDYRARRPTVDLSDGRLRRLDWPEIEVAAASVPELDHDIVFLLGPEPDLRWEGFCDAVVEVVRHLGVDRVITLGAYPAPAPHTRPIGIARAVNAVGPEDPSLPGEAVPGYSGPVGAATATQATLADAGIPCIGFWAEVPHYLGGSTVPGAALALVGAVVETLGAVIDTTELQAATKLHLGQVDEAVAEHPDAAELVETLEAAVDTSEPAPDLPTGDEMAAEIERFLRTEGP